MNARGGRADERQLRPSIRERARRSGSPDVDALTALEPVGGLVEPGWPLNPRYDVPTILREAIEQHLATTS